MPDPPPNAFSPLYEGLSPEDKRRYAEKCKQLGVVDPYLLPLGAMTPVALCQELPEVTFADIYIYLIQFPSSYMGERKAYKSLDAYKFFLAGKVGDVKVWKKCGSGGGKSIFIIRARCGHSMRMREKPLLLWVAVKEDATVLTGHCDCTAGTCKACSHVAATLFFISKASELIQRASTSQLCSWNQSTKAVEYAEGVNINFARPKNVPRPSPSVTPTSSEALSTPLCTPTRPPRSASAPPFVPDSPVGSPPSTPQPNETTPARPSRASSSTPVHVKVKRVEHRNQEAAGFFARLAKCPEKPVVLSL